MKSLRAFYTMVGTQTLSQIGSQMTAFALGIALFRDTGQATPLAIIGAFFFLPQILFGGLAGIVADRGGRKFLLVASDFGQVVPTFLMFLSLLAGTFEVWQVYLAVFVSSTIATVQQNVFSATITSLVPVEHLDRANTLRQIAFPLAGLIAPVVAGFLYAIIGLEGIMVLDMASFLVAVAVVSTLHIPDPERSTEGQAGRGSLWTEWRAGWDFLYARPSLLGLMFYVIFVNFMVTGPLQMISPYLLLLTDSEGATGFFLGLMNLGMLAGAVAFSSLGQVKNRMFVTLSGLGLFGLLISLFGLVRGPVAIGGVIFLLLSPIIVINSLFATMLQIKTPQDLQGRVMALLGQLSLLASPLSLLIVGPLVDQVLEPAVGEAAWWSTVEPLLGNEPGAGMGLLLVIAGLTMFASTVLAYSIPALRQLESRLPDYLKSEAPPQAEITPSIAPADTRAGTLAPAPLDK
jgi:MFS family permease